VEPGKKVSIDLYLQTSIPEGHFGLLRLRSGVSRRFDIQLLGGVVDADYKGNLILVIQVNSSMGSMPQS
jgi:dUTPase